MLISTINGFKQRFESLLHESIKLMELNVESKRKHEMITEIGTEIHKRSIRIPKSISRPILIKIALMRLVTKREISLKLLRLRQGDKKG